MMSQTSQGNQFKADLHMHSTESDGSLTPTQLVHLAKEKGVGMIALTDHDTISGLEELSEAASTENIEWMSGVEISAVADRELHILGYGFDETNEDLVAVLKRQTEQRIQRIYEICDKLCKLGKVVYPEDIINDAAGNVGRPHVAKALVQAQHVPTVQSAFERYLADGCPAYVPASTISTGAAIDLIHSAGGVASLAHAAVDKAFLRIKRLIDEGLDAIEVQHPAHNRPDRKRLISIAKTFGLLMTGGSDLHTPMGHRTLGYCSMSRAAVDALERKRLEYAC
ncbi:MAG: PHP domain-containing protein [Myxococcota bacterium]|nr:PHP domain-containing protein [Myxococcota bacterium]